MKVRTLWQHEDGSAAVITAIAFTAILALCGLVIDLGAAYYQGSRVQNAADAAAYAASTLLPIDVSDAEALQTVRNTVAEYAQKNGMTAGSVDTVTLEDVVAGHYTSVYVQLHHSVEYYFGKIMGLDSKVVAKSAKVRLEVITSLSKMVPLGIEDSQFKQAMLTNNSQHVIVKYGGGDGTTGFFGALDLDGVKGGGAQDFASWLAFGYNGVLNVNVNLPVETGNMAGPTSCAFLQRYSSCTHYPSQGGCNALYYEQNCSRVVYLIIFTMVDAHTIKIQGFAPFVLEGTNGNGEIVASHVTVHLQQGESQAVTEQNITYGVFRSRLVA
ncbi:MAG: pilus assembly protein TadG-related protein [Clostridiaceae bacterium]|nr:pilus assembly protein TadG-related protein [Clostridiaceae bacterium]